MASTLRFTVEVAADQATGALNAMSAAFNQAGISARSSLLGIGGATKQAGAELATTGRGVSAFKENISRSREAAMFFSQSLRELGPSGATAQIAISGLAGAMLGGGGVILALEGARVGLRLLVQAINEGTEAAKAAAKEHQAAGEQIAEAYKKSADSVRVLVAEMRGGKAAAAEMQAAIAMEGAEDGIRQAAEALKTAKDAQREYSQAWVRTDEGIQLHAENVKKAEENLAAAQGLAGRVAQEEALKLNKAYDEFHEAERKRIKETSDARTKAQRDDFEAARRAHRARLELDEGLDLAGQEAKSAEQDKEREFGEWKKQFNAEVNEWVRQDEAKTLEARARAYAALGLQVGATLGAIVAGQLDVRRALAQTLQMLTKEATGYAVTAAIGAAKSQAGVPLVGPVLAITAAGSLLATLMGMIGKMPSAAGGMKVPHDTLALIHKDEHVIPKKIAQQYEAGLAGGGGGVTVNVAGYLDSAAVGRVMMGGASAVAKAQRKIARRRRS